MTGSEKEVMHLLRLAEVSDSLEMDLELCHKRIRIVKGELAVAAASRRGPSDTGTVSIRDTSNQVKESATTAEPAPGGKTEPGPSAGGLILRAPIAGTFYRSPSPSSPAYCEVGDKVSADDVVGLVEVMKLFNSVSAGADGVVTGIFAENAQSVSAGDPLMQIERES